MEVTMKVMQRIENYVKGKVPPFAEAKNPQFNLSVCNKALGTAADDYKCSSCEEILAIGVAEGQVASEVVLRCARCGTYNRFPPGE
jgi:hypothetical protein